MMPLGILLPLGIFWAIVLGAGYDVAARLSSLSPGTGRKVPEFEVWVRRFPT